MPAGLPTSVGFTALQPYTEIISRSGSTLLCRPVAFRRFMAQSRAERHGTHGRLRQAMHSTYAPPVSWPKHLPPQCPPADALPLNGRVYMLTRSVPAKEVDLKSAKEKGLYEGQDDCLRAGLSCGLTEIYLSELQDAVPNLKSRLRAYADFGPSDGVFKQTGKNPLHHTMWLFHQSLKQAPSKFLLVRS